MNIETARRLALLPVLIATSASFAGGQDAPSEETIAFFEANCMSCHTIGGGRLTGPDLKGLTERRELDWLVEFIPDPKGMIDRGDPYAAKLFQDARGVYMTKVPGIDRALAEKLVAFIAVESAKESSRYAGLQISDRPLTAVDVERGGRLFRGADSFASGAPACLSCHTVQGIGGLGGGRLGPDLTSVYARLEGRNPLAAWLSAPPGLTMQPDRKSVV